MGRRRDKALHLKNYLTTRAGVPLLSWSNADGMDAPHPFSFTVLTASSPTVWRHSLDRLPDNGDLSVVLKYDGYMDGVNNSVVGMKLPTFTTLLACWIEHHSGEIRSRTKED